MGLKTHYILGVVVSYSLWLITFVAILGAAGGVWLTSVDAFTRKVVPFSGGMLIGIALFWVLPEMADVLGWIASLAWATSGFALLAVTDRYFHPVCPACSHPHQHSADDHPREVHPRDDHPEPELEGLAAPLLLAAALHSAIDGWSVAAAHSTTTFGATFVTGIAFHKLPEGLALGAIARSSLSNRYAALACCAAAESATLLGGGLEAALAPHLDLQILRVLLAVAGGSFVYLGGHAVHGEIQRSGRAPAFWPALTGVAGSSVLRFFVS
jgi:zinc transporter ZupT